MTTFKELVPTSTRVVKDHPQALSHIEVLLGYNTLTNQPLIVGLGPYDPDFSGPTGQHLMIQGMTGIGKTVMAETMVTAAINMYTEDELEVVWLPRSLDCVFRSEIIRVSTPLPSMRILSLEPIGDLTSFSVRSFLRRLIVRTFL